MAESTPWRLIATSPSGRELTIRYGVLESPELRTELEEVRVDEGPAAVRVTVLVHVAGDEADGAHGVYLGGAETTVELGEPLGERELGHGPVDPSLADLEDVLRHDD